LRENAEKIAGSKIVEVEGEYSLNNRF